VAVSPAHEIAPVDVAPDPSRRVEPSTSGQIRSGALDDFHGNDPVVDDFPVVIDVVDEQVHRAHALGEATLELGPLPGVNDPGNEVERENLLGSTLVAVNAERDAHVQERPLCGALPPYEVGVGQCGDRSRKKLAAHPWTPLRVEHLIVKGTRGVAGKLHETAALRWLPRGRFERVSRG